MQLLIVISPLGVVLALMSLNTNIPLYAISYFKGEYDLGINASLSYMIVASNVVVTALGEAIPPRLARWHAGAMHKEFISLLRRLIALGVGISATVCFVGWMFGKQLQHGCTFLCDPPGKETGTTGSGGIEAVST